MAGDVLGGGWIFLVHFSDFSLAQTISMVFSQSWAP